MKKWKIGAGIALIFISGLIAGSAVTGLYVKHRMERIFHEGPPAIKRIIMHKLSDELHLTGDQKSEIEKIVSETQAGLQQLRLRHQPETEEILDRGLGQIKTKLTTEQQAKIEKLYGQAKQRWRLPEK